MTTSSQLLWHWTQGPIRIFLCESSFFHVVFLDSPSVFNLISSHCLMLFTIFLWPLIFYSFKSSLLFDFLFAWLFSSENHLLLNFLFLSDGRCCIEVFPLLFILLFCFCLYSITFILREEVTEFTNRFFYDNKKQESKPYQLDTPVTSLDFLILFSLRHFEHKLYV